MCPGRRAVPGRAPEGGTRSSGARPKAPRSSDALHPHMFRIRTLGRNSSLRAAWGSTPRRAAEQTARTPSAPSPRDLTLRGLALRIRHAPARLCDGDSLNAARVEFWAVLQKYRPGFDMILEFCAVFRRLLRWTMPPTWENTESRRLFGQIRPAKPPRRFGAHEPTPTPSLRFPQTHLLATRCTPSLARNDSGQLALRPRSVRTGERAGGSPRPVPRARLIMKGNVAPSPERHRHEPPVCRPNQHRAR